MSVNTLYKMLVILFMLLLPTTVSALTEKQVQAMASAVDAMLGGRKKEQLKVINHKFNFTKDLEIVQVDGSQVKALGRFTHYLIGRRDDIVTFTISFKDGAYEGFEKNVQDRGATELLELPVIISSFITLKDTEKNKIDFKTPLKEFNEFLKGASDNSWQQEAEIIILNVARVMYLNGLPLDPGTLLNPFDCRVEGNNDGCNATAACPGGMTIAAAVAACNLEFGSVSNGELSKISRNTVRVVRTSDDISKGKCVVGSHVIDRGVVVCLISWRISAR
jgi:hypothetical protein